VTAFLETREARAALARGLITGQRLEPLSRRGGPSRVAVPPAEARGGARHAPAR
jgi:hypothetical protein